MEALLSATGTGSLTDILICKFVSKTDSLWLMLHGTTIDDSMLELLHDRLVDCVALMVQLVPGLERKK